MSCSTPTRDEEPGPTEGNGTANNIFPTPPLSNRSSPTPTASLEEALRSPDFPNIFQSFSDQLSEVIPETPHAAQPREIPGQGLPDLSGSEQFSPPVFSNFMEVIPPTEGADNIPPTQSKTPTIPIRLQSKYQHYYEKHLKVKNI